MKTSLVFVVSIFLLISCSSKQTATWQGANLEKAKGEKKISYKTSEKRMILVQNGTEEQFSYKRETVLPGSSFELEIPFRDNGKEISLRHGNGKDYKQFIESKLIKPFEHIKVCSEFASGDMEYSLIKTSGSDYGLTDLKQSLNNSYQSVSKSFSKLDSGKVGFALTLKGAVEDTILANQGFKGVYTLIFDAWVISNGIVHQYEYKGETLMWSLFEKTYSDLWEGRYSSFKDLVISNFVFLAVSIDTKWIEKQAGKPLDFSQPNLYLPVPEVVGPRGMKFANVPKTYKVYDGIFVINPFEKRAQYCVVFHNTSAEFTYQIMDDGKKIVLDPGETYARLMDESKNIKKRFTANRFRRLIKGADKHVDYTLNQENAVIFDRCPIINKRLHAQTSAITVDYLADSEVIAGKKSFLKRKDGDNTLVTPDSYVELGHLEYGADKPVVRY